jgi:site-specific DNA-methyltransferase (adenine-specific)
MLGPYATCRTYVGDSRALLRDLPANSVHCCITSPPYWGQRSYIQGTSPHKALELGTEETPEEYIQGLIQVFREVLRVLRDDGTLWLNLGDSYVDKNLAMIPYRVAVELQSIGWLLRSNIVWAKGVSFCDHYVGSVMPESVGDRPTSAHEAIFLLTKSRRYHFNADEVRERAAKDRYDYPSGKSTAIRKEQGHPSRYGGESKGRGLGSIEPPPGGRNLRNVWAIPPRPYAGSHNAVFPPALIAPMIKAGCPAGGVVLDPFMGSGTTAQVAQSYGREWLGFDLDPKNEALIKSRTAQTSLLSIIGRESC